MKTIWVNYHDMHSLCPYCGSMVAGGREADLIDMSDVSCVNGVKDSNQAFCRCGWNGVVHDLTERTPSHER